MRESGSMTKQAYLAGIMVALLLAGATATVLPAFAGDEEGEKGGTTDRFGGEDDDSAGVGGLSGLILFGVIAAVIGTVGYTAYKIFVSRKKGSVSTRP